MRKALLSLLLVGCLGVFGCATPTRPPMSLAGPVDLPRFMGDWYVIAHIPTFIERHATAAVESYRLDDDGSIATTFRFHEKTLSGSVKEYHPRGFVVPGTGNAVWGMQFIWPIRADYRIIGLSDDYAWTVIGREARDYVWLMAREPTMSAEAYAAAMQVITRAGYDATTLRRVPQSAHSQN